jgi:hypothetical protein
MAVIAVVSSQPLACLGPSPRTHRGGPSSRSDRGAGSDGTQSLTECARSLAEWGLPGRGVETREELDFRAAAPVAIDSDGDERWTGYEPAFLPLVHVRVTFDRSGRRRSVFGGAARGSSTRFARRPDARPSNAEFEIEIDREIDFEIENDFEIEIEIENRDRDRKPRSRSKTEFEPRVRAPSSSPEFEPRVRAPRPSPETETELESSSPETRASPNCA